MEVLLVYCQNKEKNSNSLKAGSHIIATIVMIAMIAAKCDQQS